jgi:hypothetical protein
MSRGKAGDCYAFGCFRRIALLRSSLISRRRSSMIAHVSELHDTENLFLGRISCDGGGDARTPADRWIAK